MGRPLSGQALSRNEPTTPSKRKVSAESRSSKVGEQSRKDLLDCLPCVLYECTSSLEITYLSPNSFDLIGVRSAELLGNRKFWDDRIPREELTAVTEKIARLEQTGTASVIHKIINEAGLPVWVCHGFRADKSMIRGCIVPIGNEKRLQSLDPGIISRFIHKIGNHFQVLSLVISGLKKSLPDPRPTDLLEGALEKAVDLTRAFSEFAQGSSSTSPVLFDAVLGSVLTHQAPLFADKGVALQERFDASVRGAGFLGDPYLLELALNSVVKNALEASPSDGRVVFEAAVETTAGNNSVARVRVADSGCGIAEDKLQQVLVPFYTSKNDHEGLGLSMAARFIEMHGGRLIVTSAESNGTIIDITLPAVAASCLPSL
jgi:signal transduction histidine kinase